MFTSDVSEHTQAKAFQLKGSLFTLTVLQLQSTELAEIQAQLRDAIDKAPKFFENAPIVIDLQLLSDEKNEIDFEGLTQFLRERGLIPVGIRGGNSRQNQLAKTAGLAILSLSKTPENELPNTKRASPNAPKIETVVITKPVRSGQQVYAKNADLVVIAPVSHGAELLADGHIHVYGPLRGRALAGINGNQNARIYCQSMEAELVSIAGRYVLSETLALKSDYTQKPVQVFLDPAGIQIQPLPTVT